MSWPSNDGAYRCFGGINRWDETLSNDIKKDIEKHWNSKVRDTRFDESSDKEKYYVLSMFPYPSGILHMGHVRVYSISDVLARFFRMRGKNVLHPMGWDAFGLPAENAALERGVDPDDWTQKNIASMKALLEEMNLSFDWDREFATCDSDYYKWTQFFFLKLYEKNLVYKKEGVVNWDPLDKTVLADEQVDANGRSWRSGALVEKKMLRQWFVRTTRFAKPLYDGLNDPALKDWRDVVDIQRHWIGKCSGTTIDFELHESAVAIAQKDRKRMSIWMNRPEYIDSAKFVAIKPKSPWTFGQDEEGPLPYSLKNPFTNELLPVYATEAVKYPDGCDVHLGIPDLSEVDKAFAESLNIPISPALQKAASNEELLELREKICAEAREAGIGGYPTSSKLQDWLISRQRYWGTPIPIINCEKCGELPVSENELPVRLPKIKSIKLGKNPLKEQKDWLNVKCPKCGGHAERETDTMDTFVDSSWYYLRYLDPDNERAGFGVDKAKKLMPVDIYIGGKEHAALHLYYSRFMNYFLHSVNLVPQREPFKKLLCQGMVKSKTYRSKETGEYVKPTLVKETEDKNLVHKVTGEALLVDWEKMSKSKHNGIDPTNLIKEYGVDTIRMAVLGGGSPWSDLEWGDKTLSGITAWQHRLWLTVREFIQVRSSRRDKPRKTEEFEKLNYYMFDSRNFYVQKITDLLEHSFNVSTALSKLQGLTGALRKANADVVAFSPEYERALAANIIMMSPLAPSFSSELWAGFLKAPNRLSSPGEISWDLPFQKQEWPKVDDDYKMRSDKILGMLKLAKYKSKGERKAEKKKKKMLAVAGTGAENEVIDEDNCNVMTQTNKDEVR